MKIRYTGEADEITLRHVTFKKGEAVELDMDVQADADLAGKIAALPYFEQVKAGRPRKEKSDE